MVPAGPGELGHLDDRRQRRDERRRDLLREVRRHPRLRARDDRRAGRRFRGGARAPHGEGRGRVRPGWPDGGLGGHARHRRVGHRQAAPPGRTRRTRRDRVLPSLSAAGDAVAAISRAGIIPAALEIVDRTCLRAVDEWMHLGLPSDVDTLLLARVDERGAAGDELADQVAAVFAQAGGTDVERATDPDDIDRLFQARRLAYPALERLGPVLTEDICVPRSAVPEMLRRIQATAAAHDVTIANIAHAGDGNLHPLIIAPEGDAAAKARAKEAFDQIVADCLALGGTVTGEHGVGLLKLPGLRQELGERVLAMHRAVKDALDPAGTLNPGKAF
ncbi:FAD-linked oxidase C-terminal domain-containing protein [Curtobacterium sp. 24E2]